MKVGDPDGHGRYGVVDLDDEGRLLCHECGQWWQHLATHARLAHGIPAAEYRETHGLGLQTRLVGTGPRERMRAAFDRNRDEHLAALAEHRDPHAALSQSPSHRGVRQSRPETRAAAQRRGRATRGRDLTTDERVWLDEVDDLQVWADRARTLIADGASQRSIADAADIATPTVWQRLRRYPPGDTA